MIVILDTCALVWATLRPGDLSDAARTIAADPSNNFVVPSIGLWEVALKVKRGRLDLGMTVRGFVRRLEALDNVDIVPVSTDIWLRSVELDWSHQDPADRVVVATAGLYNAPILTADTTIRAFYPNVIW